MITMVFLCCLGDYIFMIFKKQHVIVYSNGISDSVPVSNFVNSVNILSYFTKGIEIC